MKNIKYTKEALEEAVSHSNSIAGVLHYLNATLNGALYSHIKRCIKEFNLDISHFAKRSSNNSKCSRNIHWKDILVKRRIHRREKSYVLRKAMIESGIEYKCVLCGNKGQWRNIALVLEVDHKNGDWSDNRPENIQFLCPNCHAQETRKQLHFFELNINNPVKIIKSKRVAKRCNNATICKNCGKEFYPHICSPGKYCSQKCSHKSQQRVNRPSKEELQTLIQNMSFVAIGKKFGVSDNTIRKWAKSYGIPIR